MARSGRLKFGRLYRTLSLTDGIRSAVDRRAKASATRAVSSESALGFSAADESLGPVAVAWIYHRGACFWLEVRLAWRPLFHTGSMVRPTRGLENEPDWLREADPVCPHFAVTWRTRNTWMRW